MNLLKIPNMESELEFHSGQLSEKANQSDFYSLYNDFNGINVNKNENVYDPIQTIFVSTSGSDNNLGTIDNPLNTLDIALNKINANTRYIVLRGGVYNLKSTLNLNNINNITFTNYLDEHVKIIGDIAQLNKISTYLNRDIRISKYTILSCFNGISVFNLNKNNRIEIAKLVNGRNSYHLEYTNTTKNIAYGKISKWNFSSSSIYTITPNGDGEEVTFTSGNHDVELSNFYNITQYLNKSITFSAYVKGTVQLKIPSDVLSTGSTSVANATLLTEDYVRMSFSFTYTGDNFRFIITGSHYVIKDIQIEVGFSPTDFVASDLSYQFKDLTMFDKDDDTFFYIRRKWTGFYNTTEDVRINVMNNYDLTNIQCVPLNNLSYFNNTDCNSVIKSDGIYVSNNQIDDFGVSLSRQFLILNNCSNITFNNIEFCYTDIDRETLINNTKNDMQSGLQGLIVNLLASIQITNSNNINLDRCKIHDVAEHAISVNSSQNCTINNCSIYNTGGGGVYVYDTCSDITIKNNEIHDVGKFVKACNAIFIEGSETNGSVDNVQIIKNKLYNSVGSLLSIGWQWYHDPANDNTKFSVKNSNIQLNDIHDIGMTNGHINDEWDILEDVGGIYALGNCYNTIVQQNKVYNVFSDYSLGCGIYLDQSTSNITVTKNVVYNVAEKSFRVGGTLQGSSNLAHNNTITYNIFIGHLSLSIPTGSYETSTIFQNNLVIYQTNSLMQAFKVWGLNTYEYVAVSKSGVFNNNIYIRPTSVGINLAKRISTYGETSLELVSPLIPNFNLDIGNVFNLDRETLENINYLKDFEQLL